MFRKSALVTGVVTVGVVPSLPIEGVDFLLGNDLAGDKVNVTPVVVHPPREEAKTEALDDDFPGIFPSCVVTHSQSKEVGLKELKPLLKRSGFSLVSVFGGFKGRKANRNSERLIFITTKR